MNTEVKVEEDGTQKWYKNGKLHRDRDEPAVIKADGSRWWYKDGKYHRDGDEPAVIYANWNSRVVGGWGTSSRWG
jgi:protein associated with RNAse G/E